MEVLFIGGTSFFGRAAVEMFLGAGHRVTILSRGKSRPPFWHRVEHIAADRQDHGRFGVLLRGREFDAVVDNVAFDGPDVQAVVDAMGGRCGHYILTSSGSVYREQGDWHQFRPFYEDEVDLDYRGDFPYSEGKRRAEQVLWSLPTHDRPFPFTILRPPVVEGPHDDSGRTWFWVQRVADGGPLLIPRASPSAVFRTAFSEDVAAAIVLAAGNPRAHGRAYNVGGEEIYTLEDYVNTMAMVMDRHPRVAVAPTQWIQAQPSLGSYNPPFAAERYVPDIAAAKRDLGFCPTPFPRWLATTAKALQGENEGRDSEGYAHRAAEVKAAERWLEP